MKVTPQQAERAVYHSEAYYNERIEASIPAYWAYDNLNGWPQHHGSKADAIAAYYIDAKEGLA